MKYLKINKNLLALVLLMVTAMPAWAQNTAAEPAMADVLRTEGKIYIVVGVLTIIFLGIIVYLINLDSKLKRLENLIKDK